MARQTKRGICELCGAHTNVGMNHGSAACPACTHVQTALNKRPEAVAKAIRAMGKTEEMLSALIPAGGLAVKVTADLLQEISGIVGYDGEDPAELVAAVRRVASGGAQQLTSEAEAGALRTIAGIVGYGGTDGEELVEAVRRRVLTCASCDAEEVLHEIREIVGYTPDMGDSGLADAVLALTAASGKDCTDEEIRLRDDLARACDMGQDYSHRWGSVAQGAIQEIARLLNIQHDLTAIILRAHETIDNLRNEIARLNGQTHSESEQVTALRDDLARSTGVIEQLRAEITLLEQSHDEWEQRVTDAEINVETLEADLRDREDRSFNRLGLLDIAIAALRGDAVPADQIAGLLAIARKVAA